MDSLVPYSSSSSSDEDSDKLLDIPTAPKLPCALGKLGIRYKSKTDEDQEIHSNNALHNNRIRSFKHERGNWATYVYVAVEESSLEGIPECIQKELEDFVEIHLCTDLHISLSRTVVLQYHWIDNFVRSLEKMVRNEICFTAFLDEIECYVNEEKTRTFIGFKVHSNQLMDLMHKVDAVMANFKLQRFYEDPSFHISFAWCLGDKLNLLTSQLDRLRSLVQTDLDKNLTRAINVNGLHCKIGHKIYSFKLSSLR